MDVVKSNIVEGLRFVMVRALPAHALAQLDDIIFAGTDARPSRNLAEITLHLDNQMKKAPAEYNQYEELEITRKVERGKGSAFTLMASRLEPVIFSCYLLIRLPGRVLPVLSRKGGLGRLSGQNRIGAR